MQSDKSYLLFDKACFHLYISATANKNTLVIIKFYLLVPSENSLVWRTAAFSPEYMLMSAGNANLQMSSLAEELGRKTEDASRQQEEITHLLSQIVDLQKKAKLVRLLQRFQMASTNTWRTYQWRVSVMLSASFPVCVLCSLLSRMKSSLSI